MTTQEISVTGRIRSARQMAREAGLKMTAVGDGLYRLQGQSHLMSAGQIIKLLKTFVPENDVPSGEA